MLRLRFYLKCFHSILPLLIEWAIFVMSWRSRWRRRRNGRGMKLFNKIKSSKGRTIIKWFQFCCVWGWIAARAGSWIVLLLAERIHVDFLIVFIQVEHDALKTVLFGWKKRKINRFYIQFFLPCTPFTLSSLYFEKIAFVKRNISAFTLLT